MKIYFAGPLFSQAEKEYNQKLCKKLESTDFTVFLPQRDGVEKNNLACRKMSKEKRRQAIFDLDKKKIFESDIFLFVLDGRVPDGGACVELGLAYAFRELAKKRKKLVGLQTDTRAAFLSAKLNPIIKISLDCIVENEKDLIKLLKHFK